MSVLSGLEDMAGTLPLEFHTQLVYNDFRLGTSLDKKYNTIENYKRNAVHFNTVTNNFPKSYFFSCYIELAH